MMVLVAVLLWIAAIVLTIVVIQDARPKRRVLVVPSFMWADEADDPVWYRYGMMRLYGGLATLILPPLVIIGLLVAFALTHS